MKISLTKFTGTKEFLVSTKKAGSKPYLGTDKVISLSLLFSLFLIFFQSLFLLLVYRSLPKELPLFYSRPWGDQQLGQRWWLWILPSLSFFTFLVNILFLKKTAAYPSVYKAMAVTCFVVIFFLLITQFKIITS